LSVPPRSISSSEAVPELARQSFQRARPVRQESDA
jgi:hypothetical protein